MKESDMDKFLESSNAVSEQLNRDIRETRMKKEQLRAEFQKLEDLLEKLLDVKTEQNHFIAKINNVGMFNAIKVFRGEEGQEIYYIPSERH